MDWSSPAFQWTASALLTIVAGSFAAYWTYRLGTRQRYWERVVETKRQRIDEFLDTTREYVQILNHVATLNGMAKIEDVNLRMSNLAMMIQRLIPDADEASRRTLDFMENTVVPDYAPTLEKADETAARCDALVTGLHNQLVSRLALAANNVQNRYARLSMVCYDPDRPGVLKKHVVQLTKRIIDNPPPTNNIDFQQEFATWVDISGHVVVYLRLDVDASLRNFNKAVKLKASWRDKHKVLSLDESSNSA